MMKTRDDVEAKLVELETLRKVRCEDWVQAAEPEEMNLRNVLLTATEARIETLKWILRD
jgi:hypothetical protein